MRPTGLQPLDAALARETYLEALGAAIFAGRLGSGVGVPETANAARGVPAVGEPPRHRSAARWARDPLHHGLLRAVPPLRRRHWRIEPCSRAGEDARWLWLACRVAPDLWDDERWHELATRGRSSPVMPARLPSCPLALTYRAGVRGPRG